MIGVQDKMMVMDNSINVDVGGGAYMSAPRSLLEWEMRYGDVERVRFVAASVIESYRYLIMECSKDEAWHRLKLMRATLRSVDV